jgi:hypothetical protein
MIRRAYNSQFSGKKMEPMAPSSLIRLDLGVIDGRNAATMTRIHERMATSLKPRFNFCPAGENARTDSLHRSKNHDW